MDGIYDLRLFDLRLCGVGVESCGARVGFSIVRFMIVCGADVATAHPSSDRCAAHFVRGISRRRTLYSSISFARDGDGAVATQRYAAHPSGSGDISPLSLEAESFPLQGRGTSSPLLLRR